MLRWATGWLAAMDIELNLRSDRPDIRPDGCPGGAATGALMWVVVAALGAGLLLFLLWAVPALGYWFNEVRAVEWSSG